MASVSQRSESCLQSVDPVLGDVVRQALIAAPPWLDFAVISGKRTAEEQRALWQKGRNANGDIVDASAVVTHKDGARKPSRHQTGKAVDIVAFRDGQISWKAEDNYIVAAYVAGFAAACGVRLTGGVRWRWDAGHLELETT